jgi:hypothetical protein
MDGGLKETERGMKGMQMALKFELTEQEANLLLFALGEQPAKMTIDLIIKLRAQAQAQAQLKTINQEG